MRRDSKPKITREQAEEILGRLRRFSCGWCGEPMVGVDDGAIVGLEGCPRCEWIWPVQGPIAVDAQREDLIAALMKCRVTVAADEREARS